MGFGSQFDKKYGTDGLGGSGDKNEKLTPEQQQALIDYGMAEGTPSVTQTRPSTKNNIASGIKASLPEHPMTSIWNELKNYPEAYNRAYDIADKQTKRSILGYKELEGTATPKDLEESTRLKYKIDAESQLALDDPMVPKSIGTLFPFMAESVKHGFRSGLFAASAGAVAGAATGPGAAVGAATGFEVGMTVGALNYVRKAEAGAAYLDMKDRGISPGIAKVAAHAYGLGAMALENVQLKMLKYLIPGGNKLANGIFKSALDKVIKEFGTRGGRAAGAVTGLAVGEGGVEASQQFLQNLFTEVGAVASDVLEDTHASAKNKKEFIQNLKSGVFESFAMAAIGSGITAIPGTSFNFLTDTKAGRKVAEDVGDSTSVPVEDAIKDPDVKQSIMEKAAKEHEDRKLEEKKKESKRPGPEDITPDKIQTGVKETPYEEPPNRAAIDDRLKDVQKQLNEGKIPEKPTSELSIFPGKDAETGKTEPKAPKAKRVVDTSGGNVKGNTLLEMRTKDDLKGVHQKDLTQPAILLKDGTVVNGPKLSKPWSISKADVARDELPAAFEAAKETAKADQKDTTDATTGFVIDDKFIPSAPVVAHFGIGEAERIARQEMDADLKNREKFAKEAENLQKARDKWAEQVKNAREPTEADLQAAELLQPAAKRAAQKQGNLDIGKHLDISDLQSAAQESLWNVILHTPPERVAEFVAGNDKPYVGSVINSIGNQLKNYKKEAFDKPRSQVIKELNQGTFKETLPLNERTLGEVPPNPVTNETGDTAQARASTIIRTPEPEEDVTAPGPVRHITPEQMVRDTSPDVPKQPGPITKVNPKTGRIAKTKRPKPKRVIKTPSEKLERKAKPAKKTRKHAAPKKASSVINERSIEAPAFERLKKSGHVVEKKGGTHAFHGIRGAMMRAAKINNALKEKDTYQVVPHPTSTGNYAIVDMKQWMKELEKDVDISKVTPYSPETPIKDSINFSGGNVPNQGSIFDQVKKQSELVAEEKAKKEATEPKVVTPEKLTDPLDKEAAKINKEIPVSKMSIFGNEKGSAPILNELSQKVIGNYDKLRNKMADIFDVEDKWERIDSPHIGLRLKNMFGKMDSVEKAESKKLAQLAKLVKGINKDITNTELTDALLAAEDPSLMETLPNEHKPIAKWIRQYFDASEKEYNDRGMDISFKLHKMTAMMEQYMDTTDYDTWRGLMNKMGTLNKLEFVHIPLAVIRREIERPDSPFKKQMAKKVRDLQNLAARKRRTLRIHDIIDKGIISKEDLNVFTLLGNYMRNKANDMAIADIRDAAIQDGKMKVQVTRPKQDKYGKWRVVPKKFAGLGYYNKAPGVVWIHDSVLNALGDAMEVVISRSKWSKAMSVAKMAQFYNPFFLPAYDFIQHIMLGPAKVWRIPGGFGRALHDVFTNSDAYLEATANGLSSKPFGITFDQYMNNARRYRRKVNRSGVPEFMMEWGARILFPKRDGKWRLPVLSAAYEASWQLAWQLDSVVRMMSYHYLRKEGHDSLSAAQTAAKFHGDYASVPAVTRKKLNSLFFTPTFQISMLKLYKQMFGNFMKTWGGLKKSGTTKSMRRLAYGAMTTGAYMMAQEMIMHSMGFDTDEFNRRYIKKIMDENGNMGELALTIATPANVPHRLWFKLMAPFNPASTNPLEAWADRFKWTLHPVWRIFLELVSNRGANGEPIYGTFDDWGHIIPKMISYGASNIVGMFRMHLSDLDASPTQIEARKKLTKMFGEFFGFIIPQFAFAYVRKPSDLRKARAIKRLGRTLRYEMQREAKKHGVPPREWIRNYQKRVHKILEED